MRFTTKPQGMWATFETTCHRCKGVLNVSNGRPEPHTCEQPITLAQLRAALDNR